MKSAPSNPWVELRETLTKQKKQYEKFLELLKKKEKELIKGNTKNIQKLIKEEEKFVSQIEELENRRIEMTRACLTGEESKDVTLKKLLKVAPETEKQQLERAAVDLMEILNRVAVINRSNAELVKESNNFINYNINLLSSDRTRDNIYEVSGRMKDPGPKKRGILNREA